MVKFKKIVPAIIFVGILLIGCSKENRNVDIEPENINVNTDINIFCGSSDIYSLWNLSKAPIPIVDDEITNLNIYLADEDGNVVNSWYLTDKKDVSATISSKIKYSIYVIANIGKELSFNKTSEIESYSYKIASINDIINSSGGVPMSGKIDNKYYYEGEQVFVPLTRSVSNIIVKCDYSRLNSDVTVKIKRVQLKNAPSSVLLFSDNFITNSLDAIDGEILNGSDLNPITNSGVSLYLFENKQNIFIDGAVDNKTKTELMSTQDKEKASYIELEYEYDSPRKFGNITYRFYIGKEYTDCKILRNTKYMCTVYFSGDASADENSESVDVSYMHDKVTDIQLMPKSKKLYFIGDNFVIDAKVIPTTADNIKLDWSSSDSDIATVDENGEVIAHSYGNCTIIAKSTDGTNIIDSCLVSVVDTDINFRTKNYFVDSNRVVQFIPFSVIVPSDAIPIITLDSYDNCEIVEVTSLGVSFKVLGEGDVIILTATIGQSSASIKIYPRVDGTHGGD